jgi:glycosyltransferase involved in cell wall biosynthesis
MTKISIVVAAYNERDNLEDLIPSFVKYEIPEKAEIIVVDSGSDDTLEYFVDKPFIKYIRNWKRLFAGEARNLGIKNASGDVIAFLDADTIVLEGWFEELLKSAKEHDIVAGAAPSLPGQKSRLPRVSIMIDGQDITWPTCNIFYKKKVLDTVGGFQVGMLGAEDVHLNYRCVKAGFKIVYNPQMKVYHKHRSTWKGFIKQSYRDGYARAELEALIPETRRKHEFGRISGRNIIRLGFGALGYAKKRWFSS